MKNVFAGVRLVFLDQDGVLNRKAPEGDYVATWEQFEFLPDAPQAVTKLNRAGLKVVVVTNQRGVAVGKMSEATLKSIHERMERELGKHSAHIDGVFYCPHDGDACECRKPKPGLLFQAFEHFREVPSPSGILIGDSLPDIQAGHGVGLRTIFVRGPATTQKAGSAEAERKADAVASSLADAVTRLLRLA
jgi:D-glycero-D-manno-heptose 1,7-bisphosphate phosphatase